MHISNARHKRTQSAHRLHFLWSSTWPNKSAYLVLLLLPYLLVLHLASALSVDGNLASSSRHAAPHSHHTEWNVDEWWGQLITEDKQQGQLEKLYQLDRSIQPRAFAQFSQADEWPHHKLAPLINFENLKEAESTDSIPVKRRRPTKVHFPLFPRLPITTSASDLDSSESLAMKTISGGSRQNHLFPKWRTATNQTTRNTTTNRNSHKVASDAKLGTSYAPKSSLPSIQSLFHEFFTTVRSSVQESSRTTFLELKRNLRRKFLDLGLSTGIQSFNVTRFMNRPPIKGHNLIGIWPGNFRNVSGKDSILVIGAHYDSVPQSIGIEDNASGSVAVIELARLLHEYRCSLNSTIMFVLFDMEEDGLYGSKHFVRDYLVPIEIEQRHVPVKGAIVMDMLLEYDTERDSQNTDDLGPLVPNWREAVRHNGNRADFAAVWARRSSIDTPLYKALKRNWLNQPNYKLFQMDVPLPPTGRQLTKDLRSRKLSGYKTFLRSDHSSFWYTNTESQSIPAILITDLGPWRRRSSSRYHSSADNTKMLTRQNLQFLKNAIDSLMKTILELGGGRCQPPEANSVEAATA